MKNQTWIELRSRSKIVRDAKKYILENGYQEGNRMVIDKGALDEGLGGIHQRTIRLYGNRADIYVGEVAYHVQIEK